MIPFHITNVSSLKANGHNLNLYNILVSVTVEAYRRKAVILLLRFIGKQIHAYHWNRSLHPALEVAIHVVGLGAHFIPICVSITALFMQHCIFCPLLCMQFCRFLGNRVLPGNELPIVGDRSRSWASTPSSGLDRAGFRGSWSCISGWCRWLWEAWWGDGWCAAAGCWRHVPFLEKCFSHLLFWCHLGFKIKKKFRTRSAWCSCRSLVQWSVMYWYYKSYNAVLVGSQGRTKSISAKWVQWT